VVNTLLKPCNQLDIQESSCPAHQQEHGDQSSHPMEQPRDPRQIPMTVLTSNNSIPRLRCFESPARNVPVSPPAARADISKPNADAAPKFCFAMTAMPMLAGPVMAKFSLLVPTPSRSAPSLELPLRLGSLCRGTQGQR
jgi:hypothetical protein